MGKKQNLKSLKGSATLLFSLILSSVYSQVWIKSDSIILNQEISAYALDQKHDLYLGMVNGTILRFDSIWQQKPPFSEINYASVTTIEPWNRLKTLLYYRENQVIVFLNRFSTYTNEMSLIDLGVSFGKLGTLGVDNSFWILESNKNELRKYTISGSLDFVTPMGSMDLANASHMRAYKNLLIILDANNGFFFFDQFGNPLSQLSITGAHYFQIIENRIVTYNGEDIIHFDLFRPTEISKIKGPEEDFMGVLKSNDTYLFLQESQVIRMSLIN